MSAVQSKETLEQQRSRHAWSCCENCKSDYVNLAKGLPALITNSGLLQVLCFLESKGSSSASSERLLSSHLRKWLRIRFPKSFPEEGLRAFLEALMTVDRRLFQAITREAFDWLRWVRQMAPARCNDPADSLGSKL